MTIISAFMLLAGLCGGSILYNIFTIFIGLFGTLFLGAVTLFYIRNIFIIKHVLILENDGFMKIQAYCL